MNKRNKSWYLGYLAILMFIIISAIPGCGELITTPGSSNDMNISLMGNIGAVNNPLNVIIIDDAKALIQEVEVEKDGTGENEVIKDDPFVIHFKTDGTVQTLADASILNGNFTKIKFQIHKPEDIETPPDPEFKDGSGENLRYSFIIKGSINGNQFVYKSKQSANVVMNLDKTIGLQSSGKNITILFNTNVWFQSNGGSMDPRDPKNENEIDNNLHTSFNKAFEDDDKNGVPDGH